MLEARFRIGTRGVAARQVRTVDTDGRRDRDRNRPRQDRDGARRDELPLGLGRGAAPPLGEAHLHPTSDGVGPRGPHENPPQGSDAARRRRPDGDRREIGGVFGGRRDERVQGRRDDVDEAPDTGAEAARDQATVEGGDRPAHNVRRFRRSRRQEQQERFRRRLGQVRQLDLRVRVVVTESPAIRVF